MNDLSNQDYDHLFKILLIGDSGVGKSSIILRYTDNTFNEKLINSIGVDFKMKKITFKEKVIKIQIWDTAGHERFRSLTTSYYRGVNSIVIVFSITDKNSFEHIDIWLKEIENHAKENVLKLLVGNKCDLNAERVVSTEEAATLAKKYNIEYIETSAKDTINTNELFETAIKTFLEKNKFLNNEVKNINIGTTEIQREEKKCDC